jgi:hypothetical protein
MENARSVRWDQDFVSLFRTGAVTLGCRRSGMDNSQGKERVKVFCFSFFKKGNANLGCRRSGLDNSEAEERAKVLFAFFFF